MAKKTAADRKYANGTTYRSDGKTIKRTSAKGTKRGDSYCARSAGQMKKNPKAAKDPNSPLRLSRKKWKCSGKKSRRK